MVQLIIHRKHQATQGLIRQAVVKMPKNLYGQAFTELRWICCTCLHIIIAETLMVCPLCDGRCCEAECLMAHYNGCYTERREAIEGLVDRYVTDAAAATADVAPPWLLARAIEVAQNVPSSPGQPTGDPPPTRAAGSR